MKAPHSVYKLIIVFAFVLSYHRFLKMHNFDLTLAKKNCLAALEQHFVRLRAEHDAGQSLQRGQLRVGG